MIAAILAAFFNFHCSNRKASQAPSKLDDLANDVHRQGLNFLIGIEMRRVNDWIEAYQGDALRALFYLLAGSLVTVY